MRPSGSFECFYSVLNVLASVCSSLVLNKVLGNEFKLALVLRSFSVILSEQLFIFLGSFLFLDVVHQFHKFNSMLTLLLLVLLFREMLIKRN